ncbi:hypothetical protein FYV08_19900 [Escherichia coli]|nr:hypothetical protein [Escherichia coli]EEU9351507.1 hypothetical protein [Escherichia coli]EFJ2641333.1 hypothetical protein [Escherichia coli]EHB5941917.1 hypothetical protein [Escherichia coli]ELT3823781.1 hypothetical protein [Escherichia coli]
MPSLVVALWKLISFIKQAYNIEHSNIIAGTKVLLMKNFYSVLYAFITFKQFLSLTSVLQ